MSDSNILLKNYFEREATRNVHLACMELLNEQPDLALETKKVYYDNCFYKGVQLVSAASLRRANQSGANSNNQLI